MDKEAVGMERQAITVWKDGRYKFWSAADAAYAQNDPDWLATIPLAQQPAAQEAGLTDDEILDEFARKGLNIYDDSGATRPVGRACLDAVRRLLSRAAPSGEPVAYVECRECGRCGHTGINDAHSQDECCSNCDWTGPAPKEDVCPGCAQTGTMRAACPKCGSVYRLLCETTVGTAPQPSAQQAATLAGEGGFKDCIDAIRGTIAAGASVTYGGLSVRAYAAIALRVPDSGTEWLDEMIRTAQRDELAAKALAGMMASRDPRSPKFDPKDDADYVYAVADAMLAAREAQS